MGIDALRTPEERFSKLPDFEYPPKYIEDLRGFEGLRMAYIDEGLRSADGIFLCLHGEPTWSFLYRKMIPVFVRAGYRVIAPDMFGFGRSDKPVARDVYTFHFHRNSLLAFVERLNLRNITLVCQDWGGLLGLTLPVAAEFAERVRRLIAMNTTIGTGVPPSGAFVAWRDFVRSRPELDVAGLMKRAVPHLSQVELEAYEAPFPDAQYKAGAQAFPELVPIEPSMPGVAEGLAAQHFWSELWTGRSYMAIGAADPVLGLQSCSAFTKLSADVRSL
jgi:pimeloyl-ACP methyl ester carboxylesterase